MSHWETVESEVSDLDILESALIELGAIVKRNSIARGWAGANQSSSYGKDKQSDMVVSIPDCRFDLSVNKNIETGLYEIDGDWFDGKLKAFFGGKQSRIGKLLQMYSVHNAEYIAKKARKKTRRVVTKNSIKVLVRM